MELSPSLTSPAHFTENSRVVRLQKRDRLDKEKIKINKYKCLY
jgi:hypothetical protein